MSELRSYQFPARTSSGILFGLSRARLGAIGAAGVVFIVVMGNPTPTSAGLGVLVMGLLLASAVVRIAGRSAIDWLPVWVAYGWAMGTRNNEFYASPDLSEGQLPDGALDLPGELFGLELHSFEVPSTATVANPSPVGYGVLVDTFVDRLLALVEVSGGDFLFLDADEQQARIGAWGGLLDHIAQSLPEIARVQLCHLVGPASVATVAGYHATHGGRGTTATRDSYEQLLAAAGSAAQEHRVLLAVALDLRAARRAIRQAGGGTEGAVRVLMDRAATVEDALASAGLTVHGWLPARAIARVLRLGFDPGARASLDARPEDVADGGGVDPVAAAPTGMVEQWLALCHDSGWSTTAQVVGPPSRPVTGDFLQHLLIGVPAQRRMSLLYMPTPMAVAERRAQTQQVTSESEQALRARWGFGDSARHRREHGDAARREEELVEGRAVYRLVWTVTVTAGSPGELEAAYAQLEAAGRRCGLELRRLAGTQRQAATFTLPLCRGAR